MSGQSEENISRFARLVILQAAQDGANQIEFVMEEAAAPGRHFKIRYKVDGVSYDLLPPPAHIYEQVVAYLLQEATVTSGENGTLNGVLRVGQQTMTPNSERAGEAVELPPSTWILWSDGVDQRLVLTRDATNVSGS